MRKSVKAHLVVIDPQNDFMDIVAGPNDPVGLSIPGVNFRSTLPVPNALKDMENVANLVKRVGHKLDDIHVTLDSHRVIDIAHPGFWRDANGKRPNPFTLITHDDIANGIWLPRSNSHLKRVLKYTEELQKAGNKFVLMVWPEHCLIGSWGHNVVDVLQKELYSWEREQFANVDFVTKGTNTFTEHYGALMAEVPDPSDPSTQLNDAFLETLRTADIVGLAGEASSHCVKTTVEQITDNIGDSHLPKLHILTDCMSPVPQTPGSPDFPAIAKQFLSDMKGRGLVLTTSTDFLS